MRVCDVPDAAAHATLFLRLHILPMPAVSHERHGREAALHSALEADRTLHSLMQREERKKKKTSSRKDRKKKGSLSDYFQSRYLFGRICVYYD